MLKLLLLLGALNALELPTQGRYLEIHDDAEAYMVIDAASVERQGDVVTVRVVGAFAQDMPWDGRMVGIVQMIQDFDCAASKQRRQAAGSFTRTREVVQDQRQATSWEAVAEGSPAGRGFNHLCRGRPLPTAGDDLMTILRAYWSRSET